MSYNYAITLKLYVVQVTLCSLLMLTVQILKAHEGVEVQLHSLLTHWGRVTQISVFALQLRKATQTCVFNTRLVSTHYTLHYAKIVSEFVINF
jgi:hypothetical protein